MKTELSIPVQFYDTDCGGVVSNIAYLRFIEQARAALFENLGMKATEMNKTQLFPAVVRTEIDYRKPAILGDNIRVCAYLESVERIRATCFFRLETERDEGVTITLSEARQVVALLQMPSGKPQRMPQDWKGMATSG